MSRLLIPVLLSMLNCHQANQPQEPASSGDIPSNAISMENNPENKEEVYYFPDALIYAYEHNQEKRELWLYLNTETKEILYVPENEMIKAVISFPDGKYKIFGEDESGKRIILTQTVNTVTGEEIAGESLIPLNEKRTVSQKNIQQKDIVSQGYKMNYIKMEGGEVLFATTQIPVNSFQLYGFCRLEGDARLPVDIDYINLFKKGQLITHIERDNFKLTLLNYGPNPYEFSAAGYISD